MNKTLISLSVFVLFLIIGSTAFSATYYVTQAGSGAGNGSSYADSMSVAAHNAGSFSAGDTIYLCDNITSQVVPPSSGSAGNRIVYDGACGGHQAHTYVSTIAINSTAGLSFLTFQNIDLHDGTSGMSLSGGPHDITVTGCTLSGHNLKGVMLSSASADQYVENILVSYNTFTNIGPWGETGSNSLGYSQYSRNTITEHNTFSGNGVDRGVDGLLIENNLGDGSNHIFRYNTCSGLQENCLDLKHITQSSANEGLATYVYGNDMSNIDQIDIVIHNGCNNIHISNNTFHDSYLGIGVIKVDGYDGDGYLYVYNNLFYNMASGVMQDAYKFSAGHNSFIGNTAYHVGAENSTGYSVMTRTSYWTIKNNILYDLSIGKTPRANIYFLAGVDMDTVETDYNFHHMYSGDKAYRVGTSYYTVAQREAHGLSGDPLFISSTDFHLQPNSPALWKRAALGAPYDTDFDGLYFGHRGAPIGAYSQGNPRSRNTAGIK